MASTESALHGRGVRIILQESPNHWRLFDIIFWTIAAILKHVLAFAGYVAPLKADPSARQSFILPSIQVEGQLKLDSIDIARFSDAVNQQHKDQTEGEDASINPFFLVSMTVPLLIRILADRRCPVKPLGAVNTRNAFKYHDPRACRSPKRLLNASKTGKLSYVAVFGGTDRPGQRRKRGMEFCIIITVFQEGQAILEQELWFLQFLPKNTEPRFEPLSDEVEKKQPEFVTPDANANSVHLDQSDPKRWAASCKDYNPIHVSTLGAKLFGFSSVIAHGNHVAALAVQKLLEVSTTDRHEVVTAKSMFWHSSTPCVFEVRFLRPTTLPSKVSVQWFSKQNATGGVNLAVFAKDKLCLSGSCIDMAHMS